MPVMHINTSEFFRIAVASDIHAYDNINDDSAPSHLRITEPENEPGKHPIAGLIDLIEKEGLVADLFLSPGDLGDKAQPAGIQYAWKCLHQVGEKLRAKLVTAASGNHDLDSRYIHNDYDAKGILLGLDPPYPLPDVSLNDRYWARNFVIIEGDEYRLIILNTCAYHGTAQDEITHGRIADSTLSGLRNELSKIEPKIINILLCHHHPQQHMELRLGEYDVMKNGQLLLDLLSTGDFGRWLVIHGHKHHPKIAYASGVATSPVIFSAGSLCANLYRELQTMARNQFYLISLPYDDIDRIGLVGIIQAWDWASGSGWAPAAGLSSGLPSVCAFGFRGDPRAFAKRVANLVVEEKMDWKSVQDSLPEVSYYTPLDAITLKKELERRHGLRVIEEKGLPKEIGRCL